MRVKLAIFFVSLAVALVVLVVSSSSTAAQVHLKLHEFHDELSRQGGGQKLTERHLTLYGKVKEGSIERSGVKARFVLVDGTVELPVEHSGKTLLPDTFQDGADAGIEGNYDAARGVFVSHKVMAKCASRYEAAANASR